MYCELKETDATNLKLIEAQGKLGDELKSGNFEPEFKPCVSLKFELCNPYEGLVEFKEVTFCESYFSCLSMVVSAFNVQFNTGKTK